MKVLDVYVTEGYSKNEKGKKQAWKSRTAICVDSFKNADGAGEYIKILKLAPTCQVPDDEEDVIPAFDNNQRVLLFIPADSGEDIDFDSE